MVLYSVTAPIIIYVFLVERILVSAVIIIFVTLIIIKILKETKEKSLLNKSKPVETVDSWDAYILFKRGKKCHFEARYEEAIGFLNKSLSRKLLEDNPTYSAEFYSLRASCYQECDFDIKAINDYMHAIQHAPNDCNYYFNLSLSYSSLGEHEIAIEHVEKAIKLLKLEIPLNRQYKQNAKETGIGDLSLIYEIALYREKNIIDSKNNAPLSN